jgi:hypothetical protein
MWVGDSGKEGIIWVDELEGWLKQAKEDKHAGRKA